MMNNDMNTDNSWRNVMNYIFRLESDKEREATVKEKVVFYQVMTGKLDDASRIWKYIYGIYFYLINQRPVEEHVYENVLKLIGATKTDYQLRPYVAIIGDWYRKDTDYPGLKEILENVRRISNKDVDDVMDFMRWDTCEHNPDDKDELLGMISIYADNYIEKIRIKNHDANVHLADKLLVGEEAAKYKNFIHEYTPEKIKEYLDEYIIAQDSAKKNVAYAVYNHMLRSLYPEKHLNKSNVLLIGPSGCGKTEIVRRLKDMFKDKGIDIPIVISDFSGVVATPWKGRNKEEILTRLFDEAGKDADKAQRGIVFLDEFDKIIPEVAGGTRGYDYNNELQGQMLGMLEGTTLQVNVTFKDKQGNDVDGKLQMRTDNILFILAGAFDGLDDVIRRNMRANESTTFGMISNKKTDVDFTDENVTLENLMDYGLRAELAGRIGYASVLKPLSKEDMIRILKHSKDNIIIRYQNAMFAEDGIELEFLDTAYDALADKVQGMGIGARGLNAILHEVLGDVMFKAPSIPGIRRVVITADKVNGVGEAIYETDTFVGSTP